ncbi:hypothetical protein MAR_019296 [Mya arenaria]|uniref:Uncharacterized protein n=1 Tax=Mya arenaria TaxID=6604 RepID=A0ABY7EL25_MYAAR|nr:hypothetical protein MAR_019296 [Mya arenaria]
MYSKGARFKWSILMATSDLKRKTMWSEEVIAYVNLIIEPVLMRSMKTSGGLTRGRGMTQQQPVLWLLAMPPCAEVNNAMQELTGVNYNTACEEVSRLGSTMYVQKAKTIGNAILARIDRHTIAEYTFMKKDKATTLSTQSSVYPPAPFDILLLLRQPHKLVLVDATWALLTTDLLGITGQVQYVLDSGAHVQSIPCTRGSMCSLYTQKYGEAIVVFDGYEGTSTKNTIITSKWNDFTNRDF